MNNHTLRLESGRFYGGVVVGLQCTGFRIRVSAAVASEGAEAAYKSRIGVVTALAPKIKQHYRRLSTTPHSDKVVLCCEDPITENCLLDNKKRRRKIKFADKADNSPRHSSSCLMSVSS